MSAAWTRRARDAWGLSSALLALALFSAPGSSLAADDGPRLLEVRLDPDTSGTIRLGIRNAGGQTPAVQDQYDPLAKEGRSLTLTESDRKETRH